MKVVKNVWVFGGTGFIGRALVNSLSSLPGIRLNLLVHKRVPYHLLEHCNVFTGSLQNFNLHWFKKYPPDVIFHLARLAGSTDFIRKIRSGLGASANRRILNYLLTEKINPVVVYVSGSLMYGSLTGEDYADENSSLHPVSYAKFYYRSEFPFIDTQCRKLLDIRFARPGWIISTDSWFRTFYWQPFLHSGVVPMYGDGSQLMSVVELNSCVRQIINLAEKGKPFRNLNIFNGKPVTQEEFSNILAGILGVKVVPVKSSVFRLKFGKTAWDAFTASIPLTTLYPELRDDQDNTPEAKDILSRVVSLFENQESVFPKPPQERFIEQIIHLPQKTSEPPG